mgnify:CR=1 FL=1
MLNLINSLETRIKTQLKMDEIRFTDSCEFCGAKIEKPTCFVSDESLDREPICKDCYREMKIDHMGDVDYQ